MQGLLQFVIRFFVIQGTALQNHRRAHGHFPAPPAEAPTEVQALTFSVQSISHNNSH